MPNLRVNKKFKNSMASRHTASANILKYAVFMVKPSAINFLLSLIKIKKGATYTTFVKPHHPFYINYDKN